MSIQRLAFLKKHANSSHYNLDDEIEKMPSDKKSVARIEDLKEFDDETLEKLAPKIRLHSSEKHSQRAFSDMLQAKSKVALPNMFANSIVDKAEYSSIEPFHHILTKLPVLHSETLHNIGMNIVSPNQWSAYKAQTIPVEILHHPNLEKEHARDIVDKARKDKNPYINQMERQYSRRYGE